MLVSAWIYEFRYPITIIALVIVIIGLIVGYNWDKITARASSAVKDMHRNTIVTNANRKDAIDTTENVTPDDDLLHNINFVDGGPVFDSEVPQPMQFDSYEGDISQNDVRLEVPEHIAPPDSIVAQPL